MGGTVNWLLPDLHGSIAGSLAADEATLTHAIRYDAYGQTIATGSAAGAPSPVGEKPWRYQGRLDVSPIAGAPLYDMSARFYAPSLGAFTQLDTVMGGAQNPLSMNRFLYAEANPATLIDPTGHAACNGWDDDCAYIQANTMKQAARAKARHEQDLEKRITYRRQSATNLAVARAKRAESVERAYVAQARVRRPGSDWTPPSQAAYDALSNDEKSTYNAAHGEEAQGWLGENAFTDAILDNPTAFWIANAHQVSLARAGKVDAWQAELDAGAYVTGEQVIDYAGNPGANVASLMIYGIAGARWAGMSDAPATGGGSREGPGGVGPVHFADRQIGAGGGGTTRVAPYEVGTFRDLKSRSPKGDDLDIHHAPQDAVAQTTIPGATRQGGPSIALPALEHQRIPTLPANTLISPRDLLALDIRNLRNYTNAPNSALQELIRLVKATYPGSY